MDDGRVSKRPRSWAISAQSKARNGYRRIKRRSKFRHKERVMKQMTYITTLETITLDLLTGLTLGLATVAALMALAMPSDLVNWIHKRLMSSTLTHRHS